MECAIGLDVGTTNSKVVLCSLPSCNVIHLVKFKTPKIENGGYVDFDIDGLERDLTSALRECSVAVPAQSIKFISIASVGESGVLVYPDGTRVVKSIAWFDKRGEEFAAEVYKRDLAFRDYEITGIPAHANYGLFKLLWMREHGCAVDNAQWLPLGDYVAWWLSGVALQDESLASRTFALDLEKGKASGDILDRYGLPTDMFPELVESGRFRGQIRDFIADETGLPKECQVSVAGHDHMAGSVACGMGDREILNSTGTSEGILLINHEPVLSRQSFDKRLSNGRYVYAGLYSYYASLPTSGFAKEWAAQILGIDSDVYFGELPTRLRERYDKREFDGRELFFVPHLRGSGPPVRNIDALGCLYGFNGSTTRDDIIFSVDLGLVFELRNLYLNMVQGGACDAAKVIGPAISSPLWMQLKADILGIEVHACNVHEAVARGAVMLTARKAGYGVEASFESTIYQCDVERHAYYKRLFDEVYLPIETAISAVESSRGR